MDLKEQLNQDMKAAMKAKEADRLSTIRQLRSAIKNKEIELRKELDDSSILAVISSLVKQRRESAELYRSNNRPELADKEEAELVVLQQYLPAQLSEEELRTVITGVVAETGAAGLKDMGKVMPMVMAKVGSAAEGRLVNQIVRELLAD